jgi:hypothetical protein
MPRNAASRIDNFTIDKFQFLSHLRDCNIIFPTAEVLVKRRSRSGLKRAQIEIRI